MKTRLFCTLGPSSLNERVIERLAELGVGLFRLNLSHTKVHDAARIIRFVQASTTVPLSLDTEGAQVRTGDLVDGRIQLRENSVVRVHRRKVPGDSFDFNLYPPNIIDEFVVGDFIHIDADVLVQVVGVEPDVVHVRVLSGGFVAQNKAVTVERDIGMPPLTEKDRKILAIGRDLGIRHVALSFANRAADVAAIRAIAGADVHVISKIECRAGLANLDEIAQASDALLIDRGDLSRELPIEQIPAAQKHIIRRAHELGREVYVATNLMESMTTSPLPTRAEVNDVFNTLMDGADGLVLAAETAIGKYPIGCASMVMKIIPQYEKAAAESFEFTPGPSISLLVDPYGGELVQRLAERDAPRDPAASCDEVIEADEETLVDCEGIAIGAYSPLCGFMNRGALESVLERYRLEDGTPWTLPIVLPLAGAAAAGVGKGTRLGLADASGTIRAAVEVSEVFTADPDDIVRRWFGTVRPANSAAARLYAAGGTFVAGDVTVYHRPADAHRRYVLTPAQARSVFSKKGWNRVVAFRTRNVPHRGHERVQLAALEDTHADGLFVSVLCGPRRAWDFAPEAVLSSYQTMLDFGRFPAGKVVLGATGGYRRYSGAREAVFQAICYRNYGCSHYVIGPDFAQADPAEMREETRLLFEQLGNVGVTPVFFDEIGYDARTEAYVPHRGAEVRPLRSRTVREAVRKGAELPAWFVHEIVQENLREEQHAGRPVIYEPEFSR